MAVAGKKVSLVEVAARAGVSTATVSIALHGGRDKGGRVSAATRERVCKAAAALRYVPNSAARNLASRRTGFIGYLLSDAVLDGFNNAYFNRYLTGVEEACRKHGYGLYAARATLSDIHQVVFPERLRQQSVDGLVAIGEIPDAVFSEFERYHLPTVFLNRNHQTDNKYACFCADMSDGLAKAAAYAHALGHRRFWDCGVFTPDLVRQLRPVADTLERDHPGLRVGLTDFVAGPYDETSYAKQLFSAWQSRPNAERPTFLWGDTKLLPLFLAMLSHAGVNCPADVSAMAGADLEMNRYFNPPLSSIDYDFEALASDAVELLLRYVDKSECVPLEASQNNYPARIVDRQSTRRL